ncbi:SnoaL-like domain-containing protein [Meridianimarinicoccus sp. RP-17]|uniref:nuclear transport factor 2 family protein n=1 Tax=Meridianimarinicoccus zhengii TaxID=2056810 RepID=UPI000DAD90E6|nr:nuclear transport factor 2 family protein [Phycocomes zhengii]
MTLSEIAQALVDGCRAGTEEANLERLYAPEAVSVEAQDTGNGRVAEGLDAIRAKHAWWAENATVHAAEVEGPFNHGDDRFAVIFRIDATLFGERTRMAEVAIYTVADGRIVREEFYYGS